MCWHSKTQTWLQVPGGKGCLAKFALFIIAYSASAPAQMTREFHQTIATSIAQPVNLKVQLFEGDLEIAYSREGEVSVYALSQGTEANVRVDFLASTLSVTSDGNHVEIRQQRFLETPSSQIKIAYRIEVPYRT